MKIFRKVKEPNGHRKIYFCGIRICKYKKKEKATSSPSMASCYIPNIEEYRKNGCCFPHPVGIVISSFVSIGKNCIIYQNVTLGAKSFFKADIDASQYPKIGNNVVIYAGAVITGGITIGDNVVIGANAVISKDVPPNTLCVGIPATYRKLNEAPEQILNGQTPLEWSRENIQKNRKQG